MKTIEMEVPIQVTKDLGFKVKSSYQEPETLAELSEFGSDTLRIFNAGLKQLNRAKVRNEHNFAPIARMMAEKGIFSNVEDALNWLLKQKGLK